MPRVIYNGPDGMRYEVEVPAGHSVMEGALEGGIPGILAECGGACACATCHVYVPEPWLQRLAPMAEMETAMLDTAQERRPGSRLACQIEIGPDLDGLEVVVAGNGS